MEIHVNLLGFAASVARHPWPAPFPRTLSISLRRLSALQAGVCGRPIAAMARSDLLSLRNPNGPFFVIAAIEPEFDPLDCPDPLAGGAGTPHHLLSSFPADRPMGCPP